MSKKVLLPIGAVVIAAAVLLVYFLVVRTGAQDRPVRLAHQAIVVNLPTYAAEEQGFFRSLDVEVERTEMSSSNDILNAVIAGQTDIVPSMSVFPVLHLEIQNPGVVRVFGIGYMSPDNAVDSIIVREDSPIGSLEDLAGKKVGLFPGTTAPNFLRAVLQSRGVDASKVALVPLPPPAQVGSLASGAIDALFSMEPITTIALSRGGFRTVYGSVYASFLDPVPMGVGVISREFERKHPELAKRAIEALLEGGRFVMDRSEEARGLLPKHLNLPPPIASRVHLVAVEALDSDRIDSLQRFSDILHEIGEIPKPLDVEELVGSEE